MLNLPHLGELTRKSTEEVGWTVSEMSTRLSCERGTLSRVLSGKAGACATMALALDGMDWGAADHECLAVVTRAEYCQPFLAWRVHFSLS